MHITHVSINTFNVHVFQFTILFHLNFVNKYLCIFSVYEFYLQIILAYIFHFQVIEQYPRMLPRCNWIVQMASHLCSLSTLSLRQQSKLANNKPSSEQGATHKPTAMERKYLVWSGKYKTESEIPEYVR